MIVILFSLIPLYVPIVVFVKFMFDIITYLFFEFEKLNIVLVAGFVFIVYLSDCVSKMNVKLLYCLEDFESQLDKLFEKSSAINASGNHIFKTLY